MFEKVARPISDQAEEKAQPPAQMAKLGGSDGGGGGFDGGDKDKNGKQYDDHRKGHREFRLALPPPLRHIPNIKKLIDLAHKPNSIPIHKYQP